MNQLAGIHMRDRAYRLQVALAWLLSALICAVLFADDLERIDNRIEAMARERGAGLFSLIERTREWNARHGGVYVPVTPHTPPNPYLEHPARDVITTDGQVLTMVNPAYMTRQIAELAQSSEGVRLHITSLTPVRPTNGPDPWEADALASFEQGRKEVVGLVGEGAQAVVRYMAPLIAGEACLQCHESQGYRVGDIRGGISVTMPAQRLLGVRGEERRHVTVLYLAAFLISGALAHRMILLNRRRLLAAERLARDQEAVIAARTRALADSNARLEREVAERRDAQALLQESEARHRAVFESAAEGMIVTDPAGTIVEVNPAFSAITGYAASEVVGRNPGLLKSGRHDEAFYAEMWRSLAQSGRWEGELWNRRKDGSVYPQRLSITRMATDGGYVATFADITRRKEAEAQMQFRADHDALTGLPNRGLLHDRLDEAVALAARHGRRFAVLLVDLDFFKEVNDRLGHAAGDALLVEAGRRMACCVRASDTVARLGGDEFAVILQEAGSAAEVEDVARRLCAMLERPFDLADGSAQVAGSVGIALYPDDGMDSATLLRHADGALYQAKRAGRGRYRFHRAQPTAGTADNPES